MTFDKFKELVTLIYNEQKLQNEYINKIPSDIQSGFFDNTYVNSISVINTRLILELFGDLTEDVLYFIYEDVKDKTTPNIFVNGKSYCVYDLDSYLSYAKKELFNE